MKKNLKIGLIGIALFHQCFQLNAQDKKVELNLGNDVIVSNIYPCGDNEFFFVYGKQLLSKNAQKSIMKYNKDFEPEWANPLVFKGAYIGNVDIYNYTNSADNKITSYIFGTEQFIQVSPTGSTKEKKTLIPEKELENLAAVFTDSCGINILTLTGDKKNLSGKITWYAFSHSTLELTKKIISMPAPANIDKDNESGWRLNTVSPSGLYFCYVAYKNETKETTRPIITGNLVKVDYSGKPGEIIILDMEADKYNIIPVRYSSSEKNIFVKNPIPVNTWYAISSSGQTHPSYTFTDNAFMNIVIDEKNKNIFAFLAQSDDVKINKSGIPKEVGIGNHSELIKYMTIKNFDLSGKLTNTSTLNVGTFERGATDNYSYAANSLDFCLLPNNEGIIFKITNNGNGYIYALDKNGKQISKNKLSLFEYSVMTMGVTSDKFAAQYLSLKDYESSPYFLGLKSPVYQYFNKMDKNAKKQSLYISLKSGHILTDIDTKKDLIKLVYFKKD